MWLCRQGAVDFYLFEKSSVSAATNRKQYARIRSVVVAVNTKLPWPAAFRRLRAILVITYEQMVRGGSVRDNPALSFCLPLCVAI